MAQQDFEFDYGLSSSRERFRTHRQLGLQVTMARFVVGMCCIAAMATTTLAMPVAARSEIYQIPVEGFENALRDRLASVSPGDEIRLPSGRYSLDRALTLAVGEVVVRGAGQESTILDFSKQKAGAQSWLVISHGVTVSGLQLRNPPADGLVARGVRGIAIDGVAVVWDAEASASNGGYGIYPVNSSDVQIMNCYAKGASEAGIYVGQSVGGVVSGNTVEGNVVGLDIENSHRISVWGNTVRNNSIGILVSARPLLFQPQSSDIAVVDNEVSNNNLKNFAQDGTHISAFGEGRGVVVVGGKRTHVEANAFRQNTRSHVLFLNYKSLGLKEARDPHFTPDLVGARLAANDFGGRKKSATAKGSSWNDARGFDVIWDGIISASPYRPEAEPTPLCRVDGAPFGFLNTAKPSEHKGIPSCLESSGEGIETR